MSAPTVFARAKALTDSTNKHNQPVSVDLKLLKARHFEGGNAKQFAAAAAGIVPDEEAPAVPVNPRFNYHVWSLQITLAVPRTAFDERVALQAVSQMSIRRHQGGGLMKGSACPVDRLVVVDQSRTDNVEDSRPGRDQRGTTLFHVDVSPLTGYYDYPSQEDLRPSTGEEVCHQVHKAIIERGENPFGASILQCVFWEHTFDFEGRSINNNEVNRKS